MRKVSADLTHIERIRIENTLPRVFESEKIPASEVWKSRLTFERGGRYLIEAASGGGKSSLCAFLFGLRTDYLGKIFFNDTDISSISVDEWQTIRRMNIAYLTQELSLFPELTAIENINLKNKLTGYATDSMINDWMERLGIAFRRDYPAGRMSIGQQQRLALIRSLCQPFDFFLLDEPVSHLDADNNKTAAEIVEEAAEKLGAAVITTSVGNPLALDNPVKLKL